MLHLSTPTQKNYVWRQGKEKKVDWNNSKSTANSEQDENLTTIQQNNFH